MINARLIFLGLVHSRHLADCVGKKLATKYFFLAIHILWTHIMTYIFLYIIVLFALMYALFFHLYFIMLLMLALLCQSLG